MQAETFSGRNSTCSALSVSSMKYSGSPQSRTRVFRLFGLRGNAGKTLGTSKKFNFFDWLFRNGFHCFTAEILR